MNEGEHTAQQPVVHADAVLDSSSDDGHVYRPEVVDGGPESGRTEPGLALETGALVSLGFAISSFIVLPAIGAIVALLLAPGAKRRIRQSDGAHVGYGFAQAAQVIAFVNLAIMAVLIFVLIALVNWVFDGAGDWWNQVQEWTDNNSGPFADMGS